MKRIRAAKRLLKRLRNRRQTWPAEDREGLTGWTLKHVAQCWKHPQQAAAAAVAFQRVREAQRRANDIGVSRKGRLMTERYQYWDVPATPPTPKPRNRYKGSYTRALVAQCGNGGHDFRGPGVR